MVAADGSEAPAATAGASRRRYTRGDLEALRADPSGEAQVRWWAEVYAGLAAAGFSGEYDGIRAADEPPRKSKKGKKTATAGGGGRKKADSAAPQFLESRNADKHGCYDGNGNGNGNGVYEVIEEPHEQYESVDYEEDSDDDYEGILKPAFVVEGDPDFESGPPLDGFEYLRRVRWEANQIPRVKVAKIDLSTRNEQTLYMPEIPDIRRCSPDLCASKQWEDTFLTYFLETRMAFSEVDSSGGSSMSEGMKKTSKPGSSSEPQTAPTLTMVLSMDAVSRAATLRNYIDMIQSLNTLSRNDCLWLFALCVAVDTPFDAETCASLRSLLRKCASILATKSAIDDEVVMLNILVAISGKYFGQYENR